MNLKRTAAALMLAATGAAGLLATEANASTTGTASTATSATTSRRARVVRWIDGDTVRTTKGTVHLIGMEAPKRTQTCYRQARRNAARQAPAGSRVRLVKVVGRVNVDRYGRLLRYVQRNRRDIGYRQIVAGYADARYDNGNYGTHPRREQYRHADAVYDDKSCG